MNLAQWLSTEARKNNWPLLRGLEINLHAKTRLTTSVPSFGETPQDATEHLPGLRSFVLRRYYLTISSQALITVLIFQNDWQTQINIMPPAKSKAQPDDSRSEASSTREKLAANSSTAFNGKARRNGGAPNGGSSLRDVVSAGANNTISGTSGTATADTNPGVRIIWVRQLLYPH